MRINALKMALSFISLVSMLFTANIVFAQQWCGGCTVTGPYYNPETNSEFWIDGCNGCNSSECSSGYYQAPNGECYPVGGDGCECGEKADGSCKSCSSGFNCNRDYFQNCNGTLTSEVVSNNDCINVLNLNNCGMGSAQAIGSCCNEVKDENGNDICKANTVVTYKCCPPGTTVSCQNVYNNIRIFRPWSDGSAHCNSLEYHVVSIDYTTNCVYRDLDGDPETEKTKLCDRYYNCVSNSPIPICSCNSCTSTGPTAINVVQGSSGTSANVSWTPGTGGVSQHLYVDQSYDEVANGCPTANACEVKATSLATGTNNYPVTGLQPGATYFFRVVTYQNAGCTPSSTTGYTVPNLTLSGQVYLDNLNNCSTATPWNLGGLSVGVRGSSYSGSVGTDGRFAFYGGATNPIAYLDLTGYGASYVPSTAAGCNQGATLTSVANPSSTNYFYLTNRREAWWQAVGGSVYSAGNVRSEIPLASTSLIAPAANGAYGALMRETGTLDTGAGQVSTTGYAAQTKYRGKTMNYDYFAAHMGVLNSTPNDWTVNTLDKPDNNPDKDFYYIRPTIGEASIATPWTVAAGESYVVFVNGDLRIASDITVAPGGFLAFIVNGTLRVSPATSSIHGLYVIDGTLVTESNGGVDSPANFEGSVVTWGGVNLGRDLVGDNANSPAERFTYRPDLLTNMPDAMKVFALRWEEVVPGTFGQ